MTKSREIVFVDQNVSDLHSLLAGLRPDVEPIVLTASERATAQIATALKGCDDLHAVHIVAHGSAGEVRFGAGALSRETLDDHAAELAEIGRALGRDGQLSLWSCNTAEGERGAAFVAELAHLVAANVAAASGRVGAAARGGRWELDARSNAVDVLAPLTAEGMAAYQGVMVAHADGVTFDAIVADTGAADFITSDTTLTLQGLVEYHGSGDLSFDVYLTGGEFGATPTLVGTIALNGLPGQGGEVEHAFFPWSLPLGLNGSDVLDNGTYTVTFVEAGGDPEDDGDVFPTVNTQFTVQPNDPPAGTDSTVVTNEDTAYTFTAADFGFTDPNDNPANVLAAVQISTLPGSGTLTNNNVAVNAGDFVSVTDINGGLLVYTPPADDNGNGLASFTFQVQDDGGGSDLDLSPNTMTIDVTSVNDTPAGTDNTVSTNEDTAYIFTAADFGFTDVDGNALAAVQISTLPGAGTLTNNNVAVNAGDFVSVAAIIGGLLVYTPPADANGNGLASFTFQVQDDGGGTDLDLSPNTMTIDVTSVNDAPAGANNTVTTNEDTAFTFTAADFGFTDVDGNALAAVQISTLPGAGTLTNNNVAVNAGDFVSVAAIVAGLLVYTPPADANGNGLASFTFQVQDDGGGTDLDLSPNTMTIDVTSVNDVPTVSNAIPDQTSPRQAFWQFQMPANTFADVDGPAALTYTATLENDAALPNWLTFNAATRTFSGTPPRDGAVEQTIALKVKASDGLESASDHFSLILTGSFIGLSQDPGGFVQDLFQYTQGADTHTTGNLGELANALAGDDVVNGGLGNDTINGNFGEDKIDGGGGQNILHGDEGNDYVSSTGNLNIAFGDRGADQLYFNGDQNQLYGGDTLFNDNDWLGVNGTNNALTGGFGDEVWIGASGNANTLNGDAGNDLVFANGIGNYLYGGIGADWLGVSGSFNVLQAQQGNDYVAATGNFNTLDGGAGNDTLLAGAHIGDRFVFHVGYGIDNIVNFARHGAGGLDKIDLNGFGLDFASLQPFVSDVGGNATITINAATILTIEGVTKAQLLDSDFLF